MIIQIEVLCSLDNSKVLKLAESIKHQEVRVVNTRVQIHRLHEIPK